jgi:malonate-semialdehyde dehydrogenase (acetylating) / methylmalonate-semialdehyde dehydrogenase
VIGSAFGNSGQRCLAGSACILVGDAPTWFIPKIKEAAAKIKVGPGDAPGCAMGPVIDKQSQQRIEAFIASGHKDGATCIFGGDPRLSGDAETEARRSLGCFVNPTIFDNVRPGMDILDNEIFGPVLSIVREPTLDAALATLNRSKYGNMGVIFTSSGYSARRFKAHAQVGMVGINVGVPAPMAVFPFAGWKQSFFGDLHANGEDGVRFYTESKVVVARWM